MDTIKLKSLEFTGHGAVFGHSLYLDSQNTLDSTLALLSQYGYRVDNLRESDDRQERGVSVDQMEQEGWSLWFAALDDDRYRFGKCTHCGSLIPINGIRSEGHICPVCSTKTNGKSRIVKIWDEKEYLEWDHDFPMPETICIYETWHWFPKKRSAKLHEFIMRGLNQVSRQDYYYQDGRAAFSSYQIAGMKRFATRYTEITEAEWDSVCWKFDGPGFIEQLAYLCCHNPSISNEPNMWNTVNAIADAASGKILSDREKREAQRGLKGFF